MRQLPPPAGEARGLVLAQPRTASVRPPSLHCTFPLRMRWLTHERLVYAPLRRLFITTNGRPLPPTGPPTLALSALLAAARLAFPPDSGGGGSDLDLDDVESMCVSLMEQVRPPPHPSSLPFSPTLSRAAVALTVSRATRRAGLPQGLHPPLQGPPRPAEGPTGGLPTRIERQCRAGVDSRARWGRRVATRGG